MIIQNGTRKVLACRLFTCCVVAALAGAPATADEPRDAKSHERTELAMLGDDDLFLVLEVGRHWHGMEADSLKKTADAHPIVLAYETRNLQRSVGVSRDDIERVALLIPSIEKMEPVVFWTTRKAFDRKKVLAALLPGATEEKAGDKVVFTGARKTLAAHWIDSHTFLAGHPESVREVLKRRAGEGAGASSNVRQTAEKKPLFVAALKPSVFAAEVEKAGEEGKSYLPLVKATSWQLTAEAGKELRLSLRLQFPDEAGAKKAVPGLQKALGRLEHYLELCENEMPAFFERESATNKTVGELARPMEESIQSLRKALKTFKPQREGKRVTGTLEVKSARPVTAFVLLSSLVPRPGKEAGEK